jgi:hypothetical protein
VKALNLVLGHVLVPEGQRPAEEVVIDVVPNRYVS